MKKHEFLEQLRRGLSGLPEDDVEERLAFYSEIIDDRMDDGIPEEAAVSGVGTVDELLSQIVADIPLSKLVKEKIKPKKKPAAWEIVLLILGAPLWIPLLLTVFALILSLYLVLWSVIISLWAIFASLAAGGLAGIASGVHFACSGGGLTGIALAGAGIACAGFAVFAFFGCKAASKGLLMLTGTSALRVKNGLIRKENG